MCKHFFRIIGAEDHYLVGWVHFRCAKCGLVCHIDRFYFYRVLVGRGVKQWF